MAYRGGAAMSKLEYGSVLAASLAYLMHRQRDATGLIEFDDKITARLPASARPGHLHAILLALDRDRAGREVRRRPAAAPARRGARQAQPRRADLGSARRSRNASSSGLKHLRFRGTDVIVFQVLDPHEIQFPFRGAAKFTDVESDDEVTADPARVRDGYLEAMARAARALREGAARRRHRFPDARHVEAARLRAARVSRCAREAEVSMSFLTPLYLAGAALIALPIVLHLLRRDVAPPVPFTAVQPAAQDPGRSLAPASAARSCCCSPRASARCCCSPPPSRGRIWPGRRADRADDGGRRSTDRSAWRRRRASSGRARWRARRSTSRRRRSDRRRSPSTIAPTSWRRRARRRCARRGRGGPDRLRRARATPRRSTRPRSSSPTKPAGRVVARQRPAAQRLRRQRRGAAGRHRAAWSATPARRPRTCRSATRRSTPCGGVPSPRSATSARAVATDGGPRHRSASAPPVARRVTIPAGEARRRGVRRAGGRRVADASRSTTPTGTRPTTSASASRSRARCRGC